jgi:hypothetical protein
MELVTDDEFKAPATRRRMSSGTGRGPTFTRGPWPGRIWAYDEANLSGCGGSTSCRTHAETVQFDAGRGTSASRSCAASAEQGRSCSIPVRTTALGFGADAVTRPTEAVRALIDVDTVARDAVGVRSRAVSGLGDATWGEGHSFG